MFNWYLFTSISQNIVCLFVSNFLDEPLILKGLQRLVPGVGRLDLLNVVQAEIHRLFLNLKYISLNSKLHS